VLQFFYIRIKNKIPDTTSKSDLTDKISLLSQRRHSQTPVTAWRERSTLYRTPYTVTQCPNTPQVLRINGITYKSNSHGGVYRVIRTLDKFWPRNIAFYAAFAIRLSVFPCVRLSRLSVCHTCESRLNGSRFQKLKIQFTVHSIR